MKIECSRCSGRGDIYRVDEYIPCDKCKALGQITVYTADDIEAARKEEREKRNKDIDYFEICISGAREYLSEGEIIKADLLLHSAQMYAEAICKMGKK